ncbi:ran GTPase-activating protein 1 [Diorhabda sublineata]|uniref:ran GTPase-activating protein 1 n=1 Tax=Diorhabda sublineata TaxID=1163346 RepID=UPI0024E044FF|nr:ran GTPase-activating protein 1 [Diorhabda sublineata]
MSSHDITSILKAFEETHVSDTGVSFAGKSLKLNSEEDAKQVTNEIEKCSNLQYLNLEGNTLGVGASKEIAKSLETHPEFRRALWKDMFTGRMKTEIPIALQYLGDSLVTAGARLTELDLSDNAFGPVGVEGLASLLRSSSCYALEELRLNNNGLGITGGKLLASALTDCYKYSKEQGKCLALKVFIAGRNRLENEGAKVLAEVFKLLGTLEEITMPQNGIYHLGISALSEAFSVNRNLQIINLNDNTIGAKGAKAIASAIGNNQNLKEINLGDCLLKTRGALLLSDALKDSHKDLEEINFGFNEITKLGGLELLNAIVNKSKLKKLILDGNKFGDDGKELIKKKLGEIGKLNVLGSLDEDESEDSNEEDDEEETDKSEHDSENDETVDEETKDESHDQDVIEVPSPTKLHLSIKEFIETPSASNFLAMGPNRTEAILEEAKKYEDNSIEEYVRIMMKVSALSNNTRPEVAKISTECAEKLYKNLFIWAQKTDKLSIVNNSILVNLGIIKSEDKSYKLTWNQDGCLNMLKSIVNQNYIPASTKDTLRVFMKREVENNKDHLVVKKDILSTLS